jgi:hypothetical protein
MFLSLEIILECVAELDASHGAECHIDVRGLTTEKSVANPSADEPHVQIRHVIFAGYDAVATIQK